MSILGRLALLFVVIPLVELTFLIQVGRWVGIWPTVGLVFLTGILGATLARAEGLRTLWAFRRELASGKLPGQPLLDGLCILVGGAFLLTPGFVTDLAGFALLLPPTRRFLQKGIKGRLRRMIEDGSVRVMTTSEMFGGGWPGPEGRRSGGSGGSSGLGGSAERSRSGRDAGPDAWVGRDGWGEADDDGAGAGGTDRGDLDPEKEISQ